MNFHKALMNISGTAAAAAVTILYPGSGSFEKPPHTEYPAKLFSLDTGYTLGNGANVKAWLERDTSGLIPFFYLF